MSEATQQMKDAKAIGKAMKSLHGVGAAVVASIPIVGLKFDKIVPPNSASSGCAAIFTVILILAVFFFGRKKSPDELFKAAFRLVKYGMFAMLLYFSALTLLVVEHGGVRVVRGFWLSELAKQKISEGKAASDLPIDLLGCFGYNHAGSAWIGVPMAELLLILLLCLACSLPAAGFFALVVQDALLDRSLATRAAPASSTP